MLYGWGAMDSDARIVEATEPKWPEPEYTKAFTIIREVMDRDARRNNERKADMNETTFDQFVADEKGMRLFQQERLAAEITELMCRTMRECGINRSQLADRLHKSKGRISQILNAETNLTLRTVADIFTVLGKTLTIDADDLYVQRAPLHFLAKLTNEMCFAPCSPYQWDEAILDTGNACIKLAG